MKPVFGFKCRALTLLIATAVIVVLLAANASAYVTYNGHVLNGGVGDYGSNPRYYYITSSASSQSSEITSSMYDWIHTTARLGITTPIYWQRTYTQSASVMDIYYAAYYDQSQGISAFTEHILNNQVTNPWINNWNWGKIKLNSPSYDPLSDFNEKGTVAHEMGHLFASTTPQSPTGSCVYWRRVERSTLARPTTPTASTTCTRR